MPFPARLICNTFLKIIGEFWENFLQIWVSRSFKTRWRFDGCINSVSFFSFPGNHFCCILNYEFSFLDNVKLKTTEFREMHRSMGVSCFIQDRKLTPFY